MLVSERLRYEPKRFGMRDEKDAVRYYILAMVFMLEESQDCLPDCFKHERAELMTCLQVLPRDAVVHTVVKELNCHIYKLFNTKDGRGEE